MYINNENDATYNSEINTTMAFTQSLPARLRHVCRKNAVIET